MSQSRDQWARGVMGGDDRSARAAALRLIIALAEPAYAAITAARNILYDHGCLRAAHLGRPVISVGNITTGGTGKTPVVRWLAENMRDNGLTPAVLLRGYKAGSSTTSDERDMLSRQLGDGAVVEAGASRIESAARVLAGHPDVNVFILDDGFQHRKVAREFDLVLVNAADPFGFGRVLPRGLLREPLARLNRAHAIIITRADQASPDRLAEVEATIRRHNPAAPIYRATHAHAGLRSDVDAHALDLLACDRFFAFAGIGNPESFGDQLRRHSQPNFAGFHWFGDHHDYSARDLNRLQVKASQAGARFMVTTEKDWVKIARVPGASAGLPIYRLDLRVQFAGDDGDRLLRQILDVTRRQG